MDRQDSHHELIFIVERMKRTAKEKWSEGNLRASITLLSLLFDSLIELVHKISSSQDLISDDEDLILEYSNGIINGFFFSLSLANLAIFKKYLLKNIGKTEQMLERANADYRKMAKYISLSKIVDKESLRLLEEGIMNEDSIWLLEMLFGTGVLIMSFHDRYFLLRRFWIKYDKEDSLYKIFLGSSFMVNKRESDDLDREVRDSFTAILISNKTGGSKETVFQAAAEKYLHLYIKQLY